MSILVVGEFPAANAGADAFDTGLWRFFKSQLARAGITPSSCEWATILTSPADSRGLFSYLGTKDEAIPGSRVVLRTNRHFYLRAEYGPQVEAFRQTILALRPNLILAVGDLALWALTDETSLRSARGRITTCSFAPTQKVLPVFPPATVISSGKMVPTLFADLSKARRESLFPDIRRPRRLLHIRPTLEDLPAFEQEYLLPGSLLSVDIETKTGGITCIGIAPSPDRGIIVPFYDEEAPDGNYWKQAKDEVLAWRWVKHILTSFDYRLLGQNFQYDIQYLLRQMGIPTPTWEEDTMLMHHALQLELEKGLGFLASIYTDELSWKWMNKRKVADRTNKREDE